jgi:hypothetical protein
LGLRHHLPGSGNYFLHCVQEFLRAPEIQQPRRSPKAPTVGATESDQAFLVASLASYPQKSVFKPATLQVVLEFPLHVVRQYPAFLDKLPSEIRYNVA